MIALVEGAERQKTPNEIALNILLAGLTIIFMLAVVTLQPFAIYSSAQQSVIVLVGLLVCLIPTTIGALLSAIGIAGMDRLVQRNVLAMSGRAVEAAGDCNTLLLDKTGTITLGNRQAAEFLPLPGVDESTLAEAAQLSSLADETPEGRSIVVARQGPVRPARTRRSPAPSSSRSPPKPACRASTSKTAIVRKGAVDAVRRWVEELGGPRPEALEGHLRRDRRQRRHPARGGRRAASPRRDPPQGHRQARHRPAVRRAAPHGDPHRDDHRRQPAHRQGDRGGGRRRRLPRRGHPRRQDGLHPQGAAAAGSSSR